MKKQTKNGFTLVEISVSIAIISVLLLLIAQVIGGIISSYTKGLTVKAVNATARDLIEDFTTAITAAPARDIKDMCSLSFVYNSTPHYSCRMDGGYLFAYSERYASDVEIDKKAIGESVPISGAFCTGKYSYIWNTGYILNTTTYSSKAEPAVIKYRDSTGDIKEYKNFRLVKFLDQSRVACSSRVDLDSNSYVKISDNNYVYDLTIDVSGSSYVLPSEIEELLPSNESDLALYDFQVFHPAEDDSTFHAYYTGTFVLGTLRGGVNIRANGDYCKTPADYESDFDYCAINKFNFAAQAIGG